MVHAHEHYYVSQGMVEGPDPVRAAGSRFWLPVLPRADISSLPFNLIQRIAHQVIGARGMMQAAACTAPGNTGVGHGHLVDPAQPLKIGMYDYLVDQFIVDGNKTIHRVVDYFRKGIQVSGLWLKWIAAQTNRLFC